VILTGRRTNDPMVRHAARPVVGMMRRNGINVARRAFRVLGVTFKEACSDIHNGNVAVRERERELEGWGEREVVSDPRADAGAVQGLLPRCLTRAGQLH
jgi:UDP-N-acetyl-D-galactosamine dehydrogenase